MNVHVNSGSVGGDQPRVLDPLAVLGSDLCVVQSNKFSTAEPLQPKDGFRARACACS